MWWSSEKMNLKYHRVGQHDGAESPFLEETCALPPQQCKALHISWGIIPFVAGFFTLTALFLIWVVHSSKLNLNLDSLCTGHISQFSPVVQDVGIRFETTRFNGSLMKPTIFRQDASPEGETANFVTDRGVRVPAELASKSNLLPDQVKISQKYGGGYPANVEGLHHLHCLNLLRQALYLNYDYYHAKGEGPFRNNDTILQYHVTHCLDIIRQQLMCAVDIGVLGQVWWNRTGPEAYVDFNTKHTCRNFEAIRGWAEKHQLPDDVPDDFLEPPKVGDTVYENIP
ncbi:hypothetical protein DV736_g730, partial [Chaetothyriales sp. CBS 134916]